MITKNSPKTNPGYEVLKPLMKKFGATCSPKDFYWNVNNAYHAAESVCYDEMHRDMFAEEQMVWKRLIEKLPPEPRNLTFLDVGCGTGLVGHFVSTFCPQRVGAMHLLDPSRAMLDVVGKKTQAWPFPTILHQGDIFSLPHGLLFDVVTINSVLHHVVDLEAFLRKIQNIIQPGGFLLTGQDPRSDAADDLVLQKRKNYINKKLEKQVPPLCKLRRLIAQTIKRLLGIQRHNALTKATNQPLLEKNIIKKPIDNKTIWAITDFHVPSQPGNFGSGIAVEDLTRWLPAMELIGNLTYHYHDTPWPTLSETQRRQEMNWWQGSDTHGAQMALLWKKPL